MKKILAFFTLLSISFAANLTIDQLPVAGGVGGQEVLPFVQGGRQDRYRLIRLSAT